MDSREALEVNERDILFIAFFRKQEQQINIPFKIASRKTDEIR